MPAPVLAIATAVAHEKNVPYTAVLAALEDAFAAVVRRRLGAGVDARIEAHIDTETGDLRVRRLWTAASTVVNPDTDTLRPELKPGEVVEEVLPPPALTRQVAQSVHQIVVQRLREAVRRRQASAWSSHVGEIVYGTVARIDRNDGTWVALSDGSEAFLARVARIPGERFRVGQRLRALLETADATAKGCPLALSRRHPDFVAGLMVTEIPEISEGSIRVVKVARDAGHRSKVAISAIEGFRGDPVGACIGMRGSRIQAVTEELAGERLDIVLWDAPVAQRVLNALAPAEVERLILDEDKGVAWAAVAEDKLARAIGRAGQNIRLASQLTGFELHVLAPEALDRLQAEERAAQVAQLQESLAVDEELATALVESGFASVGDLAEEGAESFLAAEGFEPDLVAALVERARETALDDALRLAEREARMMEPFEGVSGLIPEQALVLAQAGVSTRQDLADLATDELVALTKWDTETAATLIMAARAG